MDNNTELRSSLIYFVDEALGWRKSLHHYQRFIETGDENELERLIIEVGREHFFDFYPLLNAIKEGNDKEGMMTIYHGMARGLYVPESWEGVGGKKLASVSLEFSENLFNTTSSWWKLRDWTEDNIKETGTDGLSVLALAHQLIIDTRSDFYKIFELFEVLLGNNTLLSCISNTDIKNLGKVIGTYYPLQAKHIERLASAVSNNPTLNWKDALSRNQVKSKLWLIDKLKEHRLSPEKRRITDPEHTTIIVGGWVGLLPFLMSMKGMYLDSVVNVDIDTSVHIAANELNLGNFTKFKNSKEDIRTLDFTKFKKLLIIDTIVEHFEDHGEWVATLPSSATIILQGNNMFDVPDHVNCHESLSQFVKSCGLLNIKWQGELQLPKCTRYMVTGTV
jgi:hypothetical protein